MSGSDLTTVAHTLVTSQLDCCNVLYIELPLKTVRLQLVHNSVPGWLLEFGSLTLLDHFSYGYAGCPSISGSNLLSLNFKVLHGLGAVTVEPEDHHL